MRGSSDMQPVVREELDKLLERHGHAAVLAALISSVSDWADDPCWPADSVSSEARGLAAHLERGLPAAQAMDAAD